MSETDFHIRLGRIHTPDGSRKFLKLARQLRRGAHGFARSGRSGMRVSRSGSGAQYFRRRVIVKFSVVRMSGQGRARQIMHLSYIGRETTGPDKGLDGDLRDGLFDAEGRNVDAHAFLERGTNDRHQFRIIVSPEDSLKMQDLEGYTRDLMTQMEADMGTRLDWVAACHYDTATPHAHIVLRGVRDNARNLVLPRHYIAYGFREQAERLVTLELGPMKVREAGLKLAQKVTQDRLTGLDRSLLGASQDNIVDVGGSAQPGESWTRRLDIARLKYLSRMGLANKLDGTRWKLENHMEETLEEMSEKGDIIKAIHKAVPDHDMRQKLEKNIIDMRDFDESSIEGRIIAKGVYDDISDKAFVVLKPDKGNEVFLKIGIDGVISELLVGDHVRISKSPFDPKPSDRNIAFVAKENSGIYSLEAHKLIDPGASEKYLEAHGRRIAKLYKLGVVSSNCVKSWRVPENFMDRVKELEFNRTRHLQLKVQVLERSRDKGLYLGL